MTTIMLILGVDVGLANAALVLARIDAEYTEISVEFADTFDIRQVPCLPACNLHHSRNPVDCCRHVFMYYSDVFSRADLILIERQPLTGLTDIQALFFSEFRNKSELVSPNTLHKWFGLPRNEYERRKVLVTEIAMPHIQHMPHIMSRERIHDVADAFCIVLHRFQVRQMERQQEAEKVAAEKRRLERTQRIAVDLRKFAFSGVVRRT